MAVNYKWQWFVRYISRHKKLFEWSGRQQETKAIYVESMSSFDDLRKILSTDYRRFAMEQKSERARHINTVAENHLAKLFDHHCSSWEMVLNPHPFNHPVPSSSGPDRLVPRTRAS